MPGVGAFEACGNAVARAAETIATGHIRVSFLVILIAPELDSELDGMSPADHRYVVDRLVDVIEGDGDLAGAAGSESRIVGNSDPRNSIDDRRGRGKTRRDSVGERGHDVQAAIVCATRQQAINHAAITEEKLVGYG